MKVGPIRAYLPCFSDWRFGIFLRNPQNAKGKIYPSIPRFLFANALQSLTQYAFVLPDTLAQGSWDTECPNTRLVARVLTAPNLQSFYDFRRQKDMHRQVVCLSCITYVLNDSLYDARHDLSFHHASFLICLLFCLLHSYRWFILRISVHT